MFARWPIPETMHDRLTQDLRELEKEITEAAQEATRAESHFNFTKRVLQELWTRRVEVEDLLKKFPPEEQENQ
jgi:hypothetical protein